MQNIEILASPASPYSYKMIAALRYQHIPFRVIWGRKNAPPEYPTPKPFLFPTLYYTDNTDALTAATDSTPLLQKLASKAPSRSLFPTDGLVAFLNALVEDYADEWLARPMFHYRWAHATDANAAGQFIAYTNDPTDNPTEARQVADTFSKRQIGRLGVVGSNASTSQIIEESYTRFLNALAPLIESDGFVFGARPSSADFAIYGQLTQLARVDPTPATLTQNIAPRVRAWTALMDDLSGLETAETMWGARNSIVELIQPLLKEIGATYAPVTLANKTAFLAGEDTFETAVLGARWRQQTIKYQAKCLDQLQTVYRTLSASDKDSVNPLLKETNCAALFMEN